MTTARKKLIEVALPLEAINKGGMWKNFIHQGHWTTSYR